MKHLETTHRRIDWGRYILALFITVAIFATIFYISDTVNSKRVSEMRSIQDKLSIDLLSSETQFALLNQADCSQDGNSILAPEIGQLGDRLSYMEEQLGTDNADVIGLKKYYSLLQIKDYMLVSALASKCHTKPVTIIYFYADKCDDCTKQGYVLTALREKYPLLRVYSFDANLDLSAIKTLQTITNAPASVPALVINGKTHTGFQSIEAIEKAVPALAKMLADQKAAEKKTLPKTTE